MAIVVQCHQCSKILHLDEGFRGGVCRCGGCGTLLRVPKDAGTGKAGSRPDQPGTSPSAPERPESPLHDPGLSRGMLTTPPGRPTDPPTSSGAFGSSGMRGNPGAPGQPGGNPTASTEADAITGLAALSSMKNDRSDSGKSGSGRPIPQPGVKAGRSSEATGGNTARKATTVRRDAPGQPIKSKRGKYIPPIKEALVVEPPVGGNARLKWIFISAAIIFALAVVTVLVVVLHHGAAAGPPGHSTGAKGRTPTAVAPTGPRFLNIPLVGKKIVFSLDGSSANTNSFNLVAEQVKTAVAGLAADQNFKIVIWRGNKLRVLPRRGWADAATAAPFIHFMMNFTPYGSSDSALCMPGSLRLGGDQIIFVTAKVIFPEHIGGLVGAARTHDQRIDVVSVDGERKQLAKIAEASDGVFRMVSDTELQNMDAGE